MKIAWTSENFKAFPQLKSQSFAVKAAAEGYPGINHALQIFLERWMLRSSVRRDQGVCPLLRQ